MAEEKKKVCSEAGFCYCRAIAAIAIMILIWTMQDPKIIITVLAALIVLGAGGCACRKKGLIK